MGSNQSTYLKDIMKDAYDERDMDIVMISFRGQSEGGELVTPKFYNALSVDDIREPMEYVIE
jgi:predicted alpha/beta-fold hydrolase